MTLQQVTAEIRASLKAASEATLRVADLVFMAKEEHFKGQCLEWLTWCRTEFLFGRRNAFRLARVSQYLKFCKSFGIMGALVTHGALTDIHKVEILSAIRPDKLEDFLATVDVSEMERDELRRAVRRFLGLADPQPIEQDFFEALGLPADPDALEETVKAALVLKKIPAVRAMRYAIAIFDPVIVHASDLSGDDFDLLCNGFAKINHALTEMKLARSRRGKGGDGK